MKRLIDIIVSAALLLVLCIPLAIVALILLIQLVRPVFFIQERPGYRGRIFRIVKFRTMTDERDENGELLPDKQRTRPIGKFLRSTSLDELPELWNVLKGEMSLVGPRPLLVKYLPLYDERQAHRHDVRPGITGYAQINGRNAISWEEKFDLDLYYVEHQSLRLDLEILFKTLQAVLTRKNIDESKDETMSEFKGTER